MDAMDTLREMFRYGDEANARVLKAAGELSEEQLDRGLGGGAGVRRMCRHLLAGEATWLARIRGDAEAKWPDEEAGMSIAEMLEQLEAVRAGRRAFLEALRAVQLSGRQRYRDSKGGLFEATLHEMLIQMAIHGVYHRAQILDGIQLVGGAAPEVDYMYSVRRGHEGGGQRQ